MKQTDWSNVDWSSGCFSALKNGAFVVAALLLFSKTADLFTAFAPSNLFGYEGVEWYYGAVCGLVIEGVFVTAKFLIDKSKTPLIWVYNAVLMGVTFAISALAQSVDSMLVRDTLSQQPAEVQLAVTWLVPMVPALIVGLLLFEAVIASFPADLLPKKGDLPNGHSRQ